MGKRILVYAGILVVVLVTDPLVLRLLGLARERVRRTVTPPSGSGDKCDTCLHIVNLTYDYIDQDKSEEEMETLLGKACEVIPSDRRDDCHVVVDERFPELIDNALRDVPPESLCLILRQCQDMQADPLDVI